MDNNNLPTDDLKEYGIIDENNSFSKKLSEKDVSKFLQGHIMVADNEKDRITFQLVDDNSRLLVNTYQREKDLDQIIKNSQKEIQYSEIEKTTINAGDIFRLKETPDEKYRINSIREMDGKPSKIYFEDKQGNEFNIGFDDFEKNMLDIKKDNTEFKAYVFDEKRQETVEYDLLKDITILTKIVQEKNEQEESNRYKLALEKMKNFLWDKIDLYPEIAKDIMVNINIITNEISAISGVAKGVNQKERQEKSSVEFDVNDPDLYQDVRREREEKEERELEQEKSRGFRR